MLKRALLLLLVVQAAALISAAPDGPHMARLRGPRQPSSNAGAQRVLTSTRPDARGGSIKGALLDAEGDEQLLTPAAVDAFLGQLLQVLQGTGADTAPWQEVRSHGDLLVPYLRAQRQDTLLQLLRGCMGEDNLGGAILDLHSFASQLAPADFVAWAARREGRSLSRLPGKAAGGASSSTGQATTKAALPLPASQA